YNLREAYGIYVGLCEYAYCGRPTQTTPIVRDEQITTTLSEGLPNWWGSDRSRIIRSTIQVTLDGQPLRMQYNEISRQLMAAMPSYLSGGVHTLVIHHANMLKNHNFPQRYEIRASETGQYVMSPLGARRPSLQPASRATTRP